MALAAAACVAAGAGGYLLLSGSSSSGSAARASTPVVRHASRTPATLAPTAAQKAAASQALLTRAVAASRARASVAVGTTSSQDGLNETSYGWTGLTTSSETEQVAGKGQITLRIVGPAAYLEGDGPAIEAVTGDAATADLLGGRWLEIAKGDKAYAGVMDQATFSDAQKQDWFSGTVTQLPTTTLNGQRVIPLTGAPAKDDDAGPHATATLYLAADGDPLPVRYEITSSAGHEVANYSGWGSQQLVIAPAVAIDEAWLENASAAYEANPDGTDRTSIT